MCFEVQLVVSCTFKIIMSSWRISLFFFLILLFISANTLFLKGYFVWYYSPNIYLMFIICMLYYFTSFTLKFWGSLSLFSFPASRLWDRSGARSLLGWLSVVIPSGKMKEAWLDWDIDIPCNCKIGLHRYYGAGRLRWPWR